MHLLPEDTETTMHFSIFGRDSLNGNVVNEKGMKVKYIFGQNIR